MSTYKDNKKLKKNLLIVGIILVIGVCFGIGMYFLLDAKEPVKLTSKGTESSEIVKIGNVKCTPKKDIKTYLFMGVDQRGELTKIKKYNGTGQCDVLKVLVLDDKNKTYKTLTINRDTMVDMLVYNENGESIGEMNGQIALAHANGDVADFGSKVTKEVVSKFLNRQVIDGYVALNMDSIKVLNHLADGVTVKITDDFSKSDKTLKKGETVKLNDNQAYHYVHDRKNVADGTNENRMARQEVYLNELKSTYMDKFNKSNKFVETVYKEVEKYMNTDMSLSKMSKVALKLSKYKEVEGPTLEGTSKMGEFGFMEFRVDKNSLNNAIIDLFYDKVEK